MCGILLCTTAIYQSLSNVDLSCLNRRGPDLVSSCEFSLEEIPYTAYCSAPSHQGCLSLTQPVQFSDFVLLWDGTIYDQEGSRAGVELLVQGLCCCVDSTDAIVDTFSRYNGSFAFVLVHKTSKRVFFGRDRFGRRSLVCNSSLSSLSSISGSNDDNYFEVPASGIYTAHASKCDGFQIDAWYPWSERHAIFWREHPFHTTFDVVDVRRPLVTNALTVTNVCDPVESLLRCLGDAVSVRVRLTTRSCHDCHISTVASNNEAACLHACIGVLFSGGLDSTVVAALADRYVPRDQPIDLINVAFQHLQPKAQPSKRRGESSDGGVTVYASPETAPDRQTALSSFDELRRLNPSRHWHLVLVDVSVDELRRIRQERVRQLLKPSPETILNDSLSLSMWFAARGRGRLICSGGCDLNVLPELYTSPSWVLLTGTGADEQLGGYSRHRDTFNRHGADAVEAELQLEMQRIAERNLGRDDRMISDHGREARHPFLDEKVVHYLATLPLASKVDFSLPRGAGEKRILRLAAESLGLPIAAGLPKRAMQFGSRVAKSENLQKVHGADRNLVDEE